MNEPNSASANAGNYDIRNLYVFVRPTTAQGTVGRLLADADVNLAAGALLDLNASTQTVRSVTGLGTVSNGTLAATAILSPAGDGVVGRPHPVLVNPRQGQAVARRQVES